MYQDNLRLDTNLSVQTSFLQVSSHYLVLTEQLTFVAAVGSIYFNLGSILVESGDFRRCDGRGVRKKQDEEDSLY